MYQATTIKDLLRLGVNVHVPGGYQATSLKDFARLAEANGAHLTITVNGKYQATTLKDLARIGGKHVTLIL
jgi:hypothetical protein